MDLKVIILSAVSQKDKYHVVSLTLCVASKTWHMCAYLPNRNWLRDTESKLMVTKVCAKDELGTGVKLHKILWIK